MYKPFSFNYKSIVVEQQFWRIVSSAFAHYSFFHILFNMFSLWSFRFLESQVLGHLNYIILTFILMILSSIATLIIYLLLMRFLNWNHYYEHVHAVGYSAIIFGLLTYGSLLNPKGNIELLFGLRIPALLVPFFYLIVSSLLFPQASFVGHLGGIIAGLLVAANLFSWMFDSKHIAFSIVFALFLLVMAWSLRLHDRIFNRGSMNTSANTSEEIIGDRSILGSLVPIISRFNPWRRDNYISVSNYTIVNGMIVPRRPNPIESDESENSTSEEV
jgi:membrane associated rhomboid family serine protease